MPSAIERLAEHEQQPHHMGRMAEPQGIGNVGSIVVGRALRWFVACREGRIEEARYQVFACAEMVPSASVLSGLCRGLPLEEAAELDEAAICAELGELPRDALPLVSWPVIASRQAIAAAGGPAFELAPDPEPCALVCRCYGVSEQTIEAAITDLGAGVQVADVLAATAAGSGCGSCTRDIQALIDAHARDPGSEAAAPAAVVGTGRVALLKRIDRVSAEVLARSGGAIELWDLQGTTVQVRVRQAGEAVAPQLDRLQRLLQDEVEPALRVEVVED